MFSLMLVVYLLHHVVIDNPRSASIAVDAAQGEGVHSIWLYSALQLRIGARGSLSSHRELPRLNSY